MSDGVITKIPELPKPKDGKRLSQFLRGEKKQFLNLNPQLIEFLFGETADKLREYERTEVLAGVRAVTRAATRDIADEVTTPFRAWSPSIYLCALQVRLLDYRVGGK